MSQQGSNCKVGKSNSRICEEGTKGCYVMHAPVCPYCDRLSVLVTGKEVYPHRPDLAHKRFYVCEPCGARVGCHPETSRPLGRLANAELRKAKMEAHEVFDKLWKSELGGPMKRKEAYAWLAEALGIGAEDCHIGAFDRERCIEVVEKSSEKFKEYYVDGVYDGRHLTDELHPNGRCTCWNEGRCMFCKAAVSKQNLESYLSAWNRLNDLSLRHPNIDAVDPISTRVLEEQMDEAWKAMLPEHQDEARRLMDRD